jgi:YidC/Oxa1 family membrane protein insertase
MKQNYIAFFIASILIMVVWFWLNPPQAPVVPTAPTQTQQSAAAAQQMPETTKPAQSVNTAAALENANVKEEEFTIETDIYKVTLTNRGAAIKNFLIREKDGDFIDLVSQNSAPVMENFPGSNYKARKLSDTSFEFSYSSPLGWSITKTFTFNPADYMHSLQIQMSRPSAEVTFPAVDVAWGPGLGTSTNELKENLTLTRVVGLPSAQGQGIKKFKNDKDEPANLFRWAAIDNRYFLAAFIPDDMLKFTQISSNRKDKKSPYTVTLRADNNRENAYTYNVKFYAGPKGYSFLRTYNLGLEHTVDFGFFGFLGKAALSILTYFYKITGNFGWAIIMLTVIIQILVLPLTLKSFKASAAMKHVQPKIKEIQEKFKKDPQRLNVEMMNLYKTQKVNPLGGCLPMLLQLPIFWAFFTMLRNAYELRNAPWVLWVSDLSMPDALLPLSGNITFNVLPLIMGLGMFLQQRMTMVSADPAQQRIMYILPVVFTFMFWGFPSGLVLYWLTNSVCSMIVQFFVLRKDEKQRSLARHA